MLGKGQQRLTSRNKRATAQQLKLPVCEVLPLCFHAVRGMKDEICIGSSQALGLGQGFSLLLTSLVSLGLGGSRSGHSRAQDHSNQHTVVPLLPAPTLVLPSLQTAHSSGSAEQL